MRRALVLVSLLAATTLRAQEVPTRRLLAERAATTVGSEAWFELGFELVETQLSFDVAAAVRTANELAAAADTDDRRRVAMAMVGLATTLHEGPIAAAAKRPTSNPTPTGHEPIVGHDLSEDAPPRLAAFHHAALALQAYHADVPGEFLPSMFAAMSAARRSGDPGSLARAGWTLHLITEQHANPYDVELLRELARHDGDPRVERFRAWAGLNHYWIEAPAAARDERNRQLEAVAATATAIGDRRVQVYVTMNRALLAAGSEDYEQALLELATARELADQLGDCRLVTIGHEIAAEIELHRDRPEAAAEHIERGTTRGGARGFPDREVQLAHLRLRLATVRKDDATVTAVTQELDRMRRDEANRYRGFAAILEHLLTDERQRVQMERQLAHERDEAARTFRTTATTGSVALAVLLGLSTWLTLRSRRRLATAHAALQAEVEHTAAESAARRQLEQRLRQMERVESLGMVAGGVAHDFNNLMVAVLGNADLLRTDVHDAEARQLLDAITAAGQRGARLCSDLQAFAADRSRDPDELDLARLLRDLVPVLQAAAGPSVQVALEAGPSALQLTGNATELEQALLNLLTNARDAKAKQVTLRTSRVERTEADWRNERVHGVATAGAFACIEVQDDGEGMREELVERIFDPFFTTRFPGRGLGLAVVSGALRRHRGVVTVDSAIGRGTTFRLYLPLVARDQALPAAPADSPKLPASVEPMTVLVVDDEANVREVVAAALTRRGHRVVTVGEGARVADAARQLAGSPRLVALVDLTMPGMDGRDVVQVLQVTLPGVPVVLMSGHATDHLQTIAQTLQVASHVAKPFLPSELEGALAAVFTPPRRLQPPAVPPARGNDAKTAAS